MNLPNVSPQADAQEKIEHPTHGNQTRDAEIRRYIIVGLIGAGIMLVVVADPLGDWLISGMGLHMSASDADLTVRILGVMAFAAGLIERLVLCWEDTARYR